MSYCRWSSDDYQCDVYTYESVLGGWQTHVAARRYVFKEPLPEPVEFTKENSEAWLARHLLVQGMMDPETMVEIGLPADGESFFDATPGEAARTLRGLKALGYRVPDYAIEALEEEEADGKDRQGAGQPEGEYGTEDGPTPESALR